MELCIALESQWEYACRAGTTTIFSYGDTITPGDANWNYGTDPNRTVDVGQFRPNPWGFFDMHGNVWEWTADAYQAHYPTGNPYLIDRHINLGSALVRIGLCAEGLGVMVRMFPVLRLPCTTQIKVVIIAVSARKPTWAKKASEGSVKIEWRRVESKL